MKPVQELLTRYNVGKGWVDPFAGITSPAEFTNDIEAREGVQSKQDGLEFLKLINLSKPTGIRFFTHGGVLFDPPYSVEQCLRCYTPKFKGTAGRAEYWAKCKDEIKAIVAPGGHVISFAWDSCGMGKTRGFEIEEVMLLCHGACHNDTIITVETKL